ncbi:MAG: serine protease [Comamonadaceae bacterium]|nr:MAG: serine protease [Comamonadaceae bacterium]
MRSSSPDHLLHRSFHTSSRSAPRLSRVAVPILLALAALSAASPLYAATAATTTDAQPSVQAVMDAMSRANNAVVGIKVTATEGAKSAESLGAERVGSGVVIDQNGLVLTIGYLMLEAQQIEIVTEDGKSWPATAVGYDSATGFGLIRPLLPLRGIAPVTLGSLQDLRPGEALMAVTGATDDDELDVSMTQLVDKRPFSGTWEYHIDAAIFTSPPVTAGRGNHSGAPLFNQRGELVGIGSLLLSDTSGPIPGAEKPKPGNMFVPVDLLKPILAEMRQSGSTRQSHRPWLGVTSADRGGQVQIMRVSEDSPASSAGLVPGQVVLAIDGAAVNTLEGFYKKLWARETADTPVKLTVREGSEVKTVELQPQDRTTTFKKPQGI